MKQAIFLEWGPPLAFVRWLLWNLALALVAVDAALIYRRLAPQKSWWAHLARLALLCVWFIFLPNTCYHLFDLRHFVNALQTTHPHGGGLIFWCAVAAWDVACGLVTFVLATRPVLSNTWPAAARGMLFLWVAAGVFLGVVIRLNSWDLLVRPLFVIHAAGAAAWRGLVFLIPTWLLLWLLYERVDRYLSGLDLHMQAGGGAAASGQGTGLAREQSDVVIGQQGG